jgi:hypothetical protein
VAATKAHRRAATVPSIRQRRGFRAWELKEWSWRIGPEATAHRIAKSHWINRGWFSTVIGFVLVLAGVKLGLQAMWLAGIVAYAFAVYCVVWTCLEVTRERRAVSLALGVRINRKTPPPPNKQARYLAWCENHGLQPYPFRPPDSPPDLRE